MRFLAIAVIAAGLDLARIPVASAEDRSTLNLIGTAGPPDWIITLGVGVEYGPRYEGASRYGFSPVPSDFDIRRPDEPAGLSAPDDGFSVSVLDVGHFSFGPVASYRGGRSRSDDRVLSNLHDINFTFDAGAFAEYWLVPDTFRTRIEVRQALHGSYGAVADLSADWFQPLGPFLLSVGPRLSAANGAYMRTYFGITEDEASAPPLTTPFDPKAGVKSVGATAALSYPISTAWRATAYYTHDWIVGDAGASPISRDGSRDQNTLGLSLSYNFGVKLN